MILYTDTESDPGMRHLLTVENCAYDGKKKEYTFQLSLDTTTPGKDDTYSTTRVTGDTPGECIHFIRMAVLEANRQIGYLAYRHNIETWIFELALKHGW